MRSNRVRIVAATLLTMMAMYLLLISCDSNPMETEPKPEELKYYRVWFYDGGATHQLLTYDIAAKTWDSIPVDWDAYYGLTVSPDQTLLYTSKGTGGVLVLSVDSLIQVADLPYVARKPVVFSPDGRLIAIPGDSLWILRTSDYELVYLDTVRVGKGAFSSDSRTYYTVSTHVRKYDLVNETVTTRGFDYTSVTQIAPTPDESKWLMYARLAPLYTWAFMVYDVAADSLIFVDTLVPGAGSLVMSHDGKRAYYGNPGTIQFGPPSTSDFKIFDVEANVVEGIVSTEHVIDSLTPHWFDLGSMAITRNDSLIVAISAPGLNQVLIYDRINMVFLDYAHFGSAELRGPSL